LALSYEDKQRVRDLWAKGNREMNSSSITDRNVSQRIIEVTDESVSDTSSMSVSGITAESSGVGSQMSQRQRNRNNNPYD
jgi:hypothetical protein